MAMLFVEQKFRLNAIEREFKYREEREEYGIEKAKQNAQMDMFAEVAGEQIMSITNAYKSSMGPGQFDQAKVDAFKAETAKNMDILQQAMISGRIDNSEMVDIAMAMQKAAMKGQQIDLSEFSGVKKYQEDYKKSADAQNLANQQMIKNFEDFRKLEKGANTTAGYNKWREMESSMKKMYPQMFKAMNVRAAKGESRDMFMKWLKSTKGTNISNIAGGSTVNGGKGGKATPVVITPPKSGTKTDTKGTPVTLPPDAPKLTDTQAQTKLQVQMVKLMGVSAQYLAQIDAKTTGEGGKIDGKVVANSLLNAANRQYGIAGVSY
jgi:hypothetical protein